MHTMPLPGNQPDITIGDRGVYLSRHAIQATIARGFTIEQVYDVLRNWENRYVQHKRYVDDGTGAGAAPYMYQKGDIGVGVIETHSVILVKTVLLRERRQWTDAEAVQRAAARSQGKSHAPA